jgi:transposase, IS5 family
MINLSDPFAVRATRLPWIQIEASVAAKFERQDRTGQLLEGQGLFGPTVVVAGAGVSHAIRPRLPIRLMASLLYLQHSFNLSDEELVVRWSENVLWQFFGAMTCYEHRLPCDATRESGGFGATWAKQAWSNCSRPPSIRPWPSRRSSPKNWNA